MAIVMKTMIVLLHLMAAFLLALGSASASELGGVVVDSETNEGLPSASIRLESGGRLYGTISGSNGEFSVELPQGEYLLRITYVGYGDYESTIRISGDSVELGTIQMGIAPYVMGEMSVLPRPDIIGVIVDTSAFGDPPAEGAIIQSGGIAFKTGNDGRFSLESVERGDITLEVSYDERSFPNEHVSGSILLRNTDNHRCMDTLPIPDTDLEIRNLCIFTQDNCGDIEGNSYDYDRSRGDYFCSELRHRESNAANLEFYCFANKCGSQPKPGYADCDRDGIYECYLGDFEYSCSRDRCVYGDTNQVVTRRGVRTIQAPETSQVAETAGYSYVVGSQRCASAADCPAGTGAECTSGGVCVAPDNYGRKRCKDPMHELLLNGQPNPLNDLGIPHAVSYFGQLKPSECIDSNRAIRVYSCSENDELVARTFSCECRQDERGVGTALNPDACELIPDEETEGGPQMFTTLPSSAVMGDNLHNADCEDNPVLNYLSGTRGIEDLFYVRGAESGDVFAVGIHSDNGRIMTIFPNNCMLPSSARLPSGLEPLQPLGSGIFDSTHIGIADYFRRVELGFNDARRAIKLSLGSEDYDGALSNAQSYISRYPCTGSTPCTFRTKEAHLVSAQAMLKKALQQKARNNHAAEEQSLAEAKGFVAAARELGAPQPEIISDLKAEISLELARAQITLGKPAEAEVNLMDAVSERNRHFVNALYTFARIHSDAAFFETLRGTLSGRLITEYSVEYSRQVIPHLDFIIAKLHMDNSNFDAAIQALLALNPGRALPLPSGASLAEARAAGLIEAALAKNDYEAAERYFNQYLRPIYNDEEKLIVGYNVLSKIYEAWGNYIAASLHEEISGRYNLNDPIELRLANQFLAGRIAEDVAPKHGLAKQAYLAAINSDRLRIATVTDALMQYLSFLDRIGDSNEQFRIIRQVISRYQGDSSAGAQTLVSLMQDYLNNFKSATLKGMMEAAIAEKKGRINAARVVDTVFASYYDEQAGEWVSRVDMTPGRDACIQNLAQAGSNLFDLVFNSANPINWLENNQPTQGSCTAYLADMFGVVLNTFNPIDAWQSTSGSGRAARINNINIGLSLLHQVSWKVFTEQLGSRDSVGEALESVKSEATALQELFESRSRRFEGSGISDSEFRSLTNDINRLSYSCKSTTSGDSFTCKKYGDSGFENLVGQDVDIHSITGYAYDFNTIDIYNFLNPTGEDYLENPSQMPTPFSSAWDSFIGIESATDYRQGNPAMKYMLDFEEALTRGEGAGLISDSVKFQTAVQFRQNRLYGIARNMFEELAKAGYNERIGGKTPQEWINEMNGEGLWDFADETWDSLSSPKILKSFVNPVYAVAGGLLGKAIIAMPFKFLRSVSPGAAVRVGRIFTSVQRTVPPAYTEFTRRISTFIASRSTATQRVIRFGEWGIGEVNEELLQGAIEQVASQFDPFVATLLSTTVPGRNSIRADIRATFTGVELDLINYDVMSSHRITANDLNLQIPKSPAERPIDFGSPVENKNEIYRRANYFFAKNYLQGKTITLKDGRQTTVREIVSEGQRRGTIVLANGVELADIDALRQQADLSQLTHRHSGLGAINLQEELDNWVAYIDALDLTSDIVDLNAEADAALMTVSDESLLSEEIIGQQPAASEGDLESALAELESGAGIESLRMTAEEFAASMGISPALDPEIRLAMARAAALAREQTGIDITDQSNPDRLEGISLWSNQLSMALDEQFQLEDILDEARLDGILGITAEFRPGTLFEGEGVKLFAPPSCSTCRLILGPEDSQRARFTVLQGLQSLRIKKSDRYRAETNERIDRLDTALFAVDSEGKRIHKAEIDQLLRSGLSLGVIEIDGKRYEYKWIAADKDYNNIALAIRQKKATEDSDWYGFRYLPGSGKYEIMQTREAAEHKTDEWRDLISRETELANEIAGRITKWKVKRIPCQEISSCLGKSGLRFNDPTFVEIEGPAGSGLSLLTPKRAVFGSLGDIKEDIRSSPIDIDLLVNRFLAEGASDGIIDVVGGRRYEVKIIENPEEALNTLKIAELSSVNELGDFQVPVLAGEVRGQAVLVYEYEQNPMRIEEDVIARLGEHFDQSRPQESEVMFDAMHDLIFDYTHFQTWGDIEGLALGEDISKEVNVLMQEGGIDAVKNHYPHRADIWQPNDDEYGGPASEFFRRKSWLMLFMYSEDSLQISNFRMQPGDLVARAGDYFGRNPRLGVTAGTADSDKELWRFLEENPDAVVSIFDSTRKNPQDIIKAHKTLPGHEDLAVAVRRAQLRHDIRDSNLNGEKLLAIQQEGMSHILNGDSKGKDGALKRINDFYEMLDAFVLAARGPIYEYDRPRFVRELLAPEGALLGKFLRKQIDEGRITLRRGVPTTGEELRSLISYIEQARDSEFGEIRRRAAGSQRALYRINAVESQFNEELEAFAREVNSELEPSQRIDVTGIGVSS